MSDGEAQVPHEELSNEYIKDYHRDLAQKVDAVAGPNGADSHGVDDTSPSPAIVPPLPGLSARDFHAAQLSGIEEAAKKESELEDKLEGNTLRCVYPRLPYNTDFETFRKHHNVWKEIITYYNRVALEGKSNAQKTKIYRERFVVCSWPRASNGAFIGDMPATTKHTNNGIGLWGATLLDFYNIYRCPGVRLCSSGSRISAWMKAHGGSEPETEPGRSFMIQAASEPHPRILDVYDAGLFLEALELRVSKGRVGRSMHPVEPEPEPVAEPASQPVAKPANEENLPSDANEADADASKVKEFVLPDDDLRLLKDELKEKGQKYETGDLQEILQLYQGDVQRIKEDIARLRNQENDKKRKRESKGNAFGASAPKKVNADVDVDAGEDAADAEMNALNDREKAPAPAPELPKVLENQLDVQVEGAKKDDAEPAGAEPQNAEDNEKPANDAEEQVDDQDMEVDGKEECKNIDGNEGGQANGKGDEKLGANAEGDNDKDDNMDVDKEKENHGKSEAKEEQADSKEMEKDEGDKLQDWTNAKPFSAEQKRFGKNSTQHDALYPLVQYPEPWPLRPFSAPLPRLQRQFKITYLPRKLIVHDPWGITEVSSKNALRFRSMYEAANCKWGTRSDCIHTYDLSLIPEMEAKYDYKAFDEAGGNGERAVPEAHLYLSPRRRIGSGHHSFVYQAELELPRGMLIAPRMCKECAEVLWRRTEIDLDTMTDVESRMEELWPHDVATERLFSKLYKKGLPFDKANGSADRLDRRFRILKRMRLPSLPAFCPHLRGQHPEVPPSHRVSVTIKLALPRDSNEDHEHHLRAESRVYQCFPTAMYEHWTGYNIIHPCRDPTPIGAVAPQFYGFYTPHKQNEPIRKGNYQSAILILEHCGLQISVNGLSVDDKNECLSLVRRLHYASFIHNSLYERNVLIQNGPLTSPPWRRSALHRRFRLIDYGRTTGQSQDKDNVFRQCTNEVEAILDALKLQHPQMGYEFGF